MSERELDLQTLATAPGLPGLTVAAAQTLTEAASVCLEEVGHRTGTVTLVVSGDFEQSVRLHWAEMTEQVRNTYNDLQEATELGACAIAISLLQEFAGLTVLERSRKGTGIDYWVGDPTDLPFHSKSRLEVSGILRGTKAQISGRMKEKQNQIRKSDDMGAAGWVIIIEFGTPRAEVAKYE